jgi:hypothetical protein
MRKNEDEAGSGKLGGLPPPIVPGLQTPGAAPPSLWGSRIAWIAGREFLPACGQVRQFWVRGRGGPHFPLDCTAAAGNVDF